MDFVQWRQWLRTHHQAAFVASVLFVLPFGGLIMYGLTIAVGSGVLGNEDSEVMVYLIGLPFFAASSFALLAKVYHVCAGMVISKQMIKRGIMLMPILYWGIERGSVYGLLAPRHIDLSTTEWATAVAGFWAVSLLLCSTLLFRAEPT